MFGSRILIACTVMMALAGCTGGSGEIRKAVGTQQLPACTGEGSPFDVAERPFKDWPKFYHQRVSQVVGVHMSSLEDTQTLQLQCTAEEYRSLLPPSNALKNLARLLPAWEKDEDLKKLGETDMGVVLLEFLRVYECALKEQKNNLQTRVRSELLEEQEQESADIQRGVFNDRLEEQSRTIEWELRIARPALERTMGILSGYERLRPLSLDVECLKRASLDIRNVMGLTAEASACLPKAWDPTGSLRDLPDEESADPPNTP